MLIRKLLSTITFDEEVLFVILNIRNKQLFTYKLAVSKYQSCNVSIDLDSFLKRAYTPEMYITLTSHRKN